MELIMDTSRDRLTKMFFRELGNEFPTEEQKKAVEVFDEGTLTKPIIKRMLDEGKTSGEIAQSLRMKTETIRSKIKRLKKQGAN